MRRDFAHDGRPRLVPVAVGFARGDRFAFDPVFGAGSFIATPVAASTPASATPAAAFTVGSRLAFAVGICAFVFSVTDFAGFAVLGLRRYQFSAFDLRTGFAIAPAAATPTTTPGTTAAALAAFFIALRRFSGRSLFAGGFEFVEHLIGLDFILFFVSGDQTRPHGRGNGLGLVDRHHLFAAIDRVGRMPGQCGIDVDGDRDLEALFQHAQMRALVIEHVDRDVRA